MSKGIYHRITVNLLSIDMRGCQRLDVAITEVISNKS